MSSPQGDMPLRKAPYAPDTAAIGGTPTVGVDVPISVVFLVLFIGAAIGHMTILQLNLRKGHKFIMSGLSFGFCMARVTTMVMRIVWACRPNNVRVAIAASIFVTAGVLLLFLINLIFAQRVIRAAHPHFGWRKSLSRVFLAHYILILVMLVAVITATVQSFYTLNLNTKRIDRDIQLTSSTYLMYISFLPLPMVVIGLVVPRKTRIEKFGSGRWRTKIWFLISTTILLCLGAAFRCGTAWKTPRPRSDPAWYHAKWCFYFFNFIIETIVIYLFIILRVDRRFYVPDGSKKPGDYSMANVKEADRSSTPTTMHSERRIMSEEEIFDDERPRNSRDSKDEEEGDYCNCDD